MSRPQFDDLEKGQQIGTREIPLTRADLIRYAGASGDFNPIHWNQRFAEAVGLPGVIARVDLTVTAPDAEGTAQKVLVKAQAVVAL